MQIILSTFNYYPDHAGGTEVYTKELAAYLRTKGHAVLIIAGSDKDPAIPFTVLEDTTQARVIRYSFNDVAVCGVHLKEQDAENIYSLTREGWVTLFKRLLQKLQFDGASFLLMNGLSTVSGPSLLDAFIAGNPQGKSALFVHTAFVCPKADLINRRTRSRCYDVVTPHLCAACMLSAQTNTPFFVGNLFYSLPGRQLLAKKSPTAVKLKELLKKRYDAFASMNSKLSSWVVFSSDMQQFLSIQNYASPEKIIVIRHGIDTSVFYDEKTSKPLSPINFLYAGRFEELKGIDLLAAAWKRLPDDPSRRKLTLVGNWKGKTAGEAVAKEIGLRSDVQLINGLPQQQLADLYRQTHCVVIPTKVVETGPLVFHEAIACGCDVIASDIGGQGELTKLYNRRSVAFNNNDTDSLYKAISNYQPAADREEYKVMSVSEHLGMLASRIGISVED
jgi:glycosyltransferase involved in cell wall biosynthesis